MKVRANRAVRVFSSISQIQLSSMRMATQLARLAWRSTRMKLPIPERKPPSAMMPG
ncbi:hypothetical protein D3C73_1520680 [compost metagenome]